MKLIFIGAPGVGKGTQASILSRVLGVPHISTGEIFRQMKEDTSELAQEVNRYMKKNELVPDSLVLKVVNYRLSQEDTKNGFILDGFPRTLEQAIEFDSFWFADKVIFLTAPREVITGRLLNRGRYDDTVEIIERRLKDFYNRIDPINFYYMGQGRLITVDAIGLPLEIQGKILSLLATPNGCQIG